MAAAGAPRTPARRNLLNGNPSKRKLPTKPSGAIIVSSMPECPDIFSDDADAQYMWEKVWTVAGAWLTDAETPIVEVACEVYSQKEYLRRLCRNIPRTYRVPNGTYITRPEFRELKEHRLELASLLGRLGMTPTDRTKMGVMDTTIEESITLLAERKDKREAARKTGGVA